MVSHMFSRFLHLSLIAIFLGLAFLIFTALYSYNVQDPAWTHNIQSPIKNVLGSMGAWYADLSFSFLGRLSWLIPLSLTGFGVLIWLEDGIDKELFSWRLLMLLTATLSGCVLWARHDLSPVHELSLSGGGIIGDWLSVNLEKAILSVPILMGFSLFIFIASITLLFGISWVSIMDTIGRSMIGFVSLIIGLAKPDASPPQKRKRFKKKEPMIEPLISEPKIAENSNNAFAHLQKEPAVEPQKTYTPKDLGIEIVKPKRDQQTDQGSKISQSEMDQEIPLAAAKALQQPTNEKSTAEKSEPKFLDIASIFSGKKPNAAAQKESNQSSSIGQETSQQKESEESKSGRKLKKIRTKNTSQLLKDRKKDAVVDINAFIKKPKKQAEKQALEEVSLKSNKENRPKQADITPLSQPQPTMLDDTVLQHSEEIAENTSEIDQIFEPSSTKKDVIPSFEAQKEEAIDLFDDTKNNKKEPSFDIASESESQMQGTHLDTKEDDEQTEHQLALSQKGQGSSTQNNTKDYHALISKPALSVELNSAAAEQSELKPSSYANYELPSLQLLDIPPEKRESYTEDDLAQMAEIIDTTLGQFNLKTTVMRVCPGPVITRFELELAPGIQAKKITALSQDLARALAVSRVRVEEVIPGSSYVGLEVPNKERQTVYLADVLSSATFKQSGSPLTLSLGADTSDNPVVADLMRMPHALVAGTTGSGKSVCINVMLLSMLFKASPKDLRLILVDPKMLEMSMYEDIPHLLTPVITDMTEAENALTWAVAEMERRYQLMAALKVRKIDAFNALVDKANASGQPIKDPLWQPNESVGYTKHPDLEKLPFIVIVIDELADMMMVVGKQVEQLIARLTQKARAAGIHVILATQRPSTDVLTGLIKANVPTRIAFQVSSNTDSRVIIDSVGAEKLLGHGDMLYVPPGASHPQRLHGAFVSDAETDRVTSYIRSMGEPDYINGITNKQDPEDLGAFGAAEAKSKEESDDPLYEEAVEIVLSTGKASISSVQRQLRIGYNRAARMIEEMQAQGIVSEPVNGVRKVLGRR